MIFLCYINTFSAMARPINRSPAHITAFAAKHSLLKGENAAAASLDLESSSPIGLPLAKHLTKDSRTSVHSMDKIKRWFKWSH
ncbi:uncharacterized protein BJ171DRAFT_581584 [Polychytrium aggregatum]|uniref:uncharacterized protein n=1 Tax=Polychytrium aggregatum TaxID=110093 RepID=UPI0022FE553B|nr:uncharacterized protein BJ171DRAFT_581584 [Polychytrium aggregatum]KAI9204906.1 hypothetical protein BJ171DRAFT_581584 [Polychytrium aggregatum]